MGLKRILTRIWSVPYLHLVDQVPCAPTVCERGRLDDTRRIRLPMAFRRRRAIIEHLDLVMPL